MARWAGLLAVVVGGIVLAGWAFDLAALTSWPTGSVAVKANTALCFMLLGLAVLLLCARSVARGARTALLPDVVFGLCALAPVAIGLLTLGEYVSGRSFGIDEWMFSEPPGAPGTSHPGRMAPDTAMCFVLVAGATWLVGGRRATHRSLMAAVLLASLGGTLAFVAALPYAGLGAGPTGWWGLTGMAAPTAALLVVLSATVACAAWKPDVLAWSLHRTTTAMFACGLVMLAFSGLALSRGRTATDAAENVLKRSLVAVSRVQLVQAKLVEAQSAARGYVITGDERFATLLPASADRALAALADLRRIAAADPRPDAEIARLGTRIPEALRLWQQMVEIRRAGESTVSLQREQVGFGQALVDDIQRDLGELERSGTLESQTVAQRSDSAAWRIQLTGAAGTAASLLILLAALAGMNDAATARLRADAALRKSNRHLRAIGSCHRALLRATDEDQLLRDVCRIAAQDADYPLVWVGFAEDDATRSVRVVAQHGLPDGYLDALGITWADTALGGGPVGTAIRTGRPCIVQDVGTDPCFVPWRDEAHARGYASAVALPLTVDGRVIGALSIYSGETDAFDADEIALLTELSADLAFGLATLRGSARRAQAEAALVERDEGMRRQLDELRRWQAVTLAREELGMSLKREVNDLLRRLGEPVRYASQERDPGEAGEGPGIRSSQEGS